jgi:hypothetical protein
LGLLTKKFVELIQGSPDSTIDLNTASDHLGVAKRRIYDITNVLEGVSVLSKVGKNHIRWNANAQDDAVDGLRAEIAGLAKEEAMYDDLIRSLQVKLRDLAEEEHAFGEATTTLSYVSYEDLRNVEGLRGETLIAIKAPPGTTLSVPDPDEGLMNNVRRYF